VTTKILAVRHGHVEGIAPRRFRGREDIPLSALGLLQAEATAALVKSTWQPNIIYTSPMARCVRTGTVIADACDAPNNVLHQLNDLDYGAWQWKTHEEVAERDPEQYQTWLQAPHLVRFPDGESLQDLVARTGDALRYCRQHHRGQTVVLISHDSALRALFLQLLDQPLSAYWHIAFAPCGVSEVELSGVAISIIHINQTSHLANILIPPA
jgi:phosphoserine phosphatase